MKNFIPVLLNEWERILFYDFTIEIENNQILNYKNSLYWEELIENKRNSALNKHRSKLKEIVSNDSENVQEQVANLIEIKAKELTSGGTKFDTLYIRSILAPCVQSKNVCKVTGFNIEMQKENSFLLSHTGLKYYHDTNRKIYNSIRNKYLSDKWQKTDLKTEIKEIAHNIRNRSNTLNRKQKRLYPKHQYQLY